MNAIFLSIMVTTSSLAHAKQSLNTSSAYKNYDDCVTLKVLTDDFVESAAKKECAKLGYDSKAENYRSSETQTAELLDSPESAR